jgi:hypothetical protein
MTSLTQYLYPPEAPLQQQPSEQQALLLQAALLQGEPALAAWRTWRVDADLDQLPPGGFGILPLLAYNLQGHGMIDPILDKCHGIRRRTWTQNQLHLRQVASLIQSLQDSGSTHLLLGDLLLALRDYPEQGLRMINQVQLLTPASQATAVQTQLTEAGWQPQQQKPSWRQLPPVDDNPPRLFRKPGNGLALHWYSQSSKGYSPLPTDVWQNAPSLPLNSVTTHGVNPTDCLLWVCSRGIVDFWRFGAIQWLVDALMLLRNGQPTIDWSRLLNGMTQQAVTVRMRAALHTLQNVLDAPIPSSVLQTMVTNPVRSFEQWEAQIYTRLPRKAGRLLALWPAYQRRKISEQPLPLRRG